MALSAALAFAFAVNSGSGLTLSLGGVPLIKGSWFQYYEPGWVKGYYSTQWTGQDVKKLPSGATLLTFKSGDGRAYGTVTYTPTPKSLKVDYEFNWDGDKPAMVELCSGMVWTPAMQLGKLTVGGVEQRSLLDRTYKSREELAERQYGLPSSAIAFDSPLGKVGYTSSRPDMIIFDGRGYIQDYAYDNDLFWVGALGIEVKKGQPAKFSTEWTFEPSAIQGTSSQSFAGETAKIDGAKGVAPKLPLIPQPKKVNVDKTKVLALGGQPTLRLPKGQEEKGRLFRVFLNSLWQKDARGKGVVIGKIAKLGLPSEGYQIKVTPSSATVTGQTAEGMLNGLYTLAMMSYPQNGRLVVPIGEVKDWPTIAWRGIHTFVGPKTVPFHKDFFERVLRPMKFNNAVLQCERTAWNATKGIETEMTMPKAELAKEFAVLRNMGVEPTPLIQSFGHAEWLFANGKNLDIALNPDAPYAIDPRNPKAQQKIKDIWDEAIALLKPKTIHIGMDEVAMIGMKDDAAFVTELWVKQIPYLAQIAKDHNVDLMLWGDVALAKEEAVDAANGDSVAEAEKRRSVIPAGTYIADWHYAANAQPKAFLKSLQLWKKDGKIPIASTWYQPENIYGFVTSAAEEGCGVLNTTWAGYESNPQALIASYQQHYAYLMFADYAWSGRKDTPDKLGYEPGNLLRRLFLSKPGSVAPVAGISIVPEGRTGNIQKVGNNGFEIFDPILLRSIVTKEQVATPQEVEVKVEGTAASIALAIDCTCRCDYFEKVAKVVVTLANGKTIETTLQYGLDVRTAEDKGSMVRADRTNGLCAVEISLGNVPQKVKSIRFIGSSTYAGLRIHGISLY